MQILYRLELSGDVGNTGIGSGLQKNSKLTLKTSTQQQ